MIKAQLFPAINLHPLKSGSALAMNYYVGSLRPKNTAPALDCS